jgi:hypothetical protein
VGFGMGGFAGAVVGSPPVLSPGTFGGGSVVAPPVYDGTPLAPTFSGFMTSPVVASNPAATGIDPGVQLTGSVVTAPPLVAQAAPADPAPEPGVRIILLNPQESGNTVAYQLDNQPFEMPCGYEQDLSSRASWLIEFDRGGGFGLARYTLTEGSFEFTLGPKGWDLVSTTFQVVLDNSTNAYPFNLSLEDGAVVTVAAGQSQTLSGRFPIQVSFDRGDAGAPGSRELINGVYRIAVDPKTNLLDIGARRSAPTATQASAAAPHSMKN